MIMANPSKSSFNDISPFVSSQRTPVLQFFFSPIASMWSNQLNSSLSQPISECITISGFIVNKTFDSFPGSARPFAWHRNGSQSPLNQGNFRRSCRVQVEPHRNSFAIAHHHPLRTLSAFGFPNKWTPFFAGAKLPSINVSPQRNFPRSFKAARNACQAFIKTSFSSHSFNRLQQVEGEGKWGGKSFHRAPLFATHKMPSKHARFDTRLRPPRLDGFGSNGKKDLIFFHCRSVISDRILRIQQKSSFLSFGDSCCRQFILMCNSLSRNKLQNRF